MNIVWIPLLPFVAFFVWLFLIGMKRRKLCPNCEKPLPILCSPFTKSKRQWWVGGYVCQNCGCEADVAGDEVPADSARQRRSMITVIALLSVAVMLAVILLLKLTRDHTPSTVSVPAEQVVDSNVVGQPGPRGPCCVAVSRPRHGPDRRSPAEDWRPAIDRVGRSGDTAHNL